MTLDPNAAAAILAHMNDDHGADNLAIVRAHGHPHANGADMIGVDLVGGTWLVHGPTGQTTVRVEWPGGSAADRAELRAKVVETAVAARRGR
ncbi:DUF2470 domain-containing protein [Nocardioides acrostichi]|uniref:DUF2470 domain-containing protein n=1 Tax=Nocardioides acrostichi TaxID=2784339 RepID=A0A930V3P4_9ACTN|nr:DUF2470 domain-containing protein [Nocardioides acrostichi]MBF4163276.1 DUF2470 domain-containing protein [Nocardioides acrostichi]